MHRHRPRRMGVTAYLSFYACFHRIQADYNFMKECWTKTYRTIIQLHGLCSFMRNISRRPKKASSSPPPPLSFRVEATVDGYRGVAPQ